MLLPDYRVVALYGAPQDAAWPARHRHARPGGAEADRPGRPYDRADRPVMPAFELIATLVTAAPGDDGHYRYRQSDDGHRPLSGRGARAKALLILDVQPGRASFMDEVRAYRRYLDSPTWGSRSTRSGACAQAGAGQRDRLDRCRGGQPGSAPTCRCWSAASDLPQKLLIVHQFTPGMISHKPRSPSGREWRWW